MAKAYRLASLQKHPDKPGGSEEAFKQLQEARDYPLERKHIGAMSEVLQQVPLSKQTDTSVFCFGDSSAPLSETDIVLGDSGLRTTSCAGVSHMKEEFGNAWASQNERSRGCLLIVVNGALLSDLTELLSYVAAAKRVLLVISCNY